MRGKYPWIAAINFRGNQGRRPGGCAATLIAANWAVTAAHCIGLQYRCRGAGPTGAWPPGEPLLSSHPRFLGKWLMSVVLGEHDISSIDSTDTIRKNVKLAINPIVHEAYSFPKQLQNDIALLKLAESVELGTYTPACLPDTGADYTGREAWVYGGSEDCQESLDA